VFCKVTVLAVLVVSKTCDENVSVAGEMEAAGAVPTPVRTTVCAAPRLPESSLTLSWAFTGPVADAVKVTVTVQFCPAISWLGQLFVSVNALLAEMFDKLSGLPPKLEIVRGSEPLVPTFCEKFKVAGEKLMADGRGLGKGTGVMPNT